MTDSQRAKATTLRVYVTPGCAGCRTALKMVEAVRRARPAQPVEVIDLEEQPEARLPVGVVGTPTYLLHDQVISMGNPELAELLCQLDIAARLLDDDSV